MLKELVTDLNFEYSLLIKDSVYNPGFEILKAVLISSEKRFDEVVIIDTEQNLQPALCDQKNIKVVNLFDATPQDLLTALISTIPKRTCSIIFPSITLLSMKISVPFIASILRSFRHNVNVSKIIAVVHKDVLREDYSLSLDYLFDAVVDIVPLSKEVQIFCSGHVKYLQKKSNGKCESGEEYYLLLEDGQVRTVKMLDSPSKASAIGSISKDFTSELTFNLKLNEDEKMAKNNLQLPYVKKQSEKDQLLIQRHRTGEPAVKLGSAHTGTSTDSKIIYHYDEADDMDEEDPDDDLDV